MPAEAERFPLELAIWLSPAFPVGSFAFSHGLEWAAAIDRISNADDAVVWIGDLLELGAPRNDAILLAAAWRAVMADDPAALREANGLALALSGSRERHLETTAQGNAFFATTGAAWGASPTAACVEALRENIAFPIAVGAASAARGLPLHPTLLCFVAGFVTNLASALVRLAIVGQTDAQRIIARLQPKIETLAVEAARSSLSDIGGGAFISDIAAMAHETLDTRLFRT